LKLGASRGEGPEKEGVGSSGGHKGGVARNAVWGFWIKVEVVLHTKQTKKKPRESSEEQSRGVGKACSQWKKDRRQANKRGD